MSVSKPVALRIAVLFNKPADRFTRDATHLAAESDTELSAREVCAALQQKGAHAYLLPLTQHTIRETIASLRADLVFNLVEWTGVDEPFALQTFDAMDARGIRYTGATKASYHESCDKLISKRLCRKYGLPTADWLEFITGAEPIGAVRYPMLVKVASEHSSVGIGVDSIARNEADLRRIVKNRIVAFHQPVFAETFLTGREFQVTILMRNGTPVMLPPAEIVYASGTDVPLLTYASRWDEDHHDYSNAKVALAALDSALYEEIRTMSMSAFRRLGFRDYARFDIRCDEHGTPYFLELNSNPGLGDDEEYGMTVSYKAAGMTFADFIWEIVRSAKRRYDGM